jgi:hypothetical protein
MYEAYPKSKQLVPRLTCQIGNALFVPGARLIDRDLELDVITFKIEQREVEADGGDMQPAQSLRLKLDQIAVLEGAQAAVVNACGDDIT